MVAAKPQIPELPVPDGRCPECTTAKIPLGAKRCHACGLLRRLGCPMSPYVPSERKGAGVT